MKAKLEAFAALLEQEQLRGLVLSGVDCDGNRANAKTSVHLGRKYARVDIGNSGRYMVDLATGQIVGIKAYGVPHLGHRFGTLDTIHEWDWSGYAGMPKQSVAA